MPIVYHASGPAGDADTAILLDALGDGHPAAGAQLHQVHGDAFVGLQNVIRAQESGLYCFPLHMGRLKGDGVAVQDGEGKALIIPGGQGRGGQTQAQGQDQEERETKLFHKIGILSIFS